MNFEVVFGQFSLVMHHVIAAHKWWDRGEDRVKEKWDLSCHICCRFSEKNKTMRGGTEEALG